MNCVPDDKWMISDKWGISILKAQDGCWFMSIPHRRSRWTRYGRATTFRKSQETICSFPILLPLKLLHLGQGPSRQNADFCGWCSCHTSHSCSRHKPVNKFSFLDVICILCEFRPKFSRFGLASFGSHHTFWCGNKNDSLKTKSE